MKQTTKIAKFASIFSLILGLAACSSKPVNYGGTRDDLAKKYNGKYPAQIVAEIGEPLYAWYNGPEKGSGFKMAFVQSKEPVLQWQAAAAPAGFNCFMLTFDFSAYAYKYHDDVNGAHSYHEGKCNEFQTMSRQGGMYSLPDLTKVNP